MIDHLSGYDGPAGAARKSVTRSALFYTPIFVIVLAALAYLVIRQANEGDVGIVIIIIVALVTLLLGFQSLLSLRDLGADLKETRGPIGRKWDRGEMFFFRAYFIRIGTDIFKISPLAYREIGEGDEIIVSHLPHTNTVESISRQREPLAFERPS